MVAQAEDCGAADCDFQIERSRVSERVSELTLT